MISSIDILNGLLIDVTGSDQELIDVASRKYEAEYCSGGKRGEIPLYQEGIVIFYRDRFDHAFYTSRDRSRNPYSKNFLARDRIARLLWIGALIRGEIPGTECWETQPQNGRLHPRDRLCIIWDPGYVVWLYPTNSDSEWKFSSAYPMPPAEISKKLRQGAGRKIWTIPKIIAP